MNFSKISAIVVILWIASVQSASEVIRVQTKHYEPFMYQNASGEFINGIESHLIEMISKQLDMEVKFKESSLDLESLTSNNTDIIIGGLFVDSANLSDQLIISTPYLQDDFTWCIQKARKLPWMASAYTALSPTVWVLAVFGYGYISGFILYIMIQFDEGYKQRNNRDWHYTTLLVSLPSLLGYNQRFSPKSINIRIFYAIMLVGLIFGVQVSLVNFYKFLQIRFPRYQVAAVDEIVAYQYRLMGSAQVQRFVWMDEKYTETQRHTFLTCSNISHCLVYLSEFDTIAIGASRQHILSAPTYSSEEIYCLDRNENIADYRISMIITREFERRHNINELVRRICESGFLAKWHSDYTRTYIDRTIDFGTASVRFEQLHIAFGPMLCIGLTMALLSFISEVIIERKLRQPGAARIWTHLEHFFDGKRHYFRNLPERLQRSRGYR